MGTAVETAPGAEGHSRDDDFQGGMERGIGHGRRYIGATDHMANSGDAADTTPAPTGKAVNPPGTAGSAAQGFRNGDDQGFSEYGRKVIDEAGAGVCLSRNLVNEVSGNPAEAGPVLDSH